MFRSFLGHHWPYNSYLILIVTVYIFVFTSIYYSLVHTYYEINFRSKLKLFSFLDAIMILSNDGKSAVIVVYYC